MVVKQVGDNTRAGAGGGRKGRSQDKRWARGGQWWTVGNARCKHRVGQVVGSGGQIARPGSNTSGGEVVGVEYRW